MEDMRLIMILMSKQEKNIYKEIYEKTMDKEFYFLLNLATSSNLIISSTKSKYKKMVKVTSLVLDKATYMQIDYALKARRMQTSR